MRCPEVSRRSLRDLLNQRTRSLRDLAKAAQEDLIDRSGIPYSIVHATQFFEFTKAIADASMVDGKLRLAPVHTSRSPRTTSPPPWAGSPSPHRPGAGPMDEFVPAALAKAGDTRDLVVDAHATYFGTELADDSLVPGPDAELGSISYEAWAKELTS